MNFISLDVNKELDGPVRDMIKGEYIKMLHLIENGGLLNLGYANSKQLCKSR